LSNEPTPGKEQHEERPKRGGGRNLAQSQGPQTGGVNAVPDEKKKESNEKEKRKKKDSRARVVDRGRAFGRARAGEEEKNPFS